MLLHNTAELLQIAFLFKKDLYKRLVFLHKVRTKLRLLLKPGPGPWIRTLDPDPEKPGL